jgi:hypothetical protein
VKKDLGPLWDWLPAGGLEHDPNAWSRSVEDTGRGVSAS